MDLTFVQTAFEALGEWLGKLVAGFDAIDFSFITDLFAQIGAFLSGN